MTVPVERRGCCCNVVHIERPLTHARGHPRTNGTGTCTPLFTAAVHCARGTATCLHSLCARAYIPSAGDIPPSARVPFKVELTNLRISSSLVSACKATCQKCQCIVRKWISSSLVSAGTATCQKCQCIVRKWISSSLVISVNRVMALHYIYIYNI